MITKYIYLYYSTLILVIFIQLKFIPKRSTFIYFNLGSCEAVLPERIHSPDERQSGCKFVLRIYCHVIFQFSPIFTGSRTYCNNWIIYNKWLYFISYKWRIAFYDKNKILISIFFQRKRYQADNDYADSLKTALEVRSDS